MAIMPSVGAFKWMMLKSDLEFLEEQIKHRFPINNHLNALLVMVESIRSIQEAFNLLKSATYYTHGE